MRCVAIDWSGRSTGASEFIWIAEADGGRLTCLENGRDGADTIQWLLRRAGELDGELCAGLDFAFSFPAWYCRERGWARGPEVWDGVRGPAGERLLEDERDPFWGRTHGRPAPMPDRAQLREGERALGTKSVFQIGGAGAVGTGSIRGMPHLLTLRAAGFSIWPFDAPARLPIAVEIYPRRMYRRPVTKRRWQERRRALAEWFPGHPLPLLERAAGSEDAFDAAVAALVMSAHQDELSTLPARPERALEGEIWLPATEP